MACSTGAYQHGWVPIDGHVSTAVCSGHVLAHGSKWRGTDAGANQNEVVKLLEVFRRSPERSPNLDLKALWHTIPCEPATQSPTKQARARKHTPPSHTRLRCVGTAREQQLQTVRAEHPPEQPAAATWPGCTVRWSSCPAP